MTNHLIRTQTLDLLYPGRTSSERLGVKAKAIFLDKVLPALDQLCSERCPHEEVICIDRIVIDLGELSENELEKRFVHEVPIAFKQRLSESIPNEAPVNETRVRRLADKLPASGASKASVRQLTTEDTELEWFAHVLRHGTAPWWGTQTEPLAAAFDRLQRRAPKRLEMLLHRELAFSSSRRRFCYQVKSKDVAKALDIVQSAGVATLSTAHHDLRHRIHDALTGIFPQSIKPASLVATEAKLLQLALEKTDNDAIAIAVDVVRAAVESGVTSVELKKLLDRLEIPAAQREQFRIKPAERHRPAEDVEQIDVAHTAVDVDLVQPNRDHKREDHPTKSATYVENAGIVILWPFLEKFFGHLGLDLGENHIPAIFPVRFKAVHLLHLLASGKESVAEPQLPLMKLLCGLNISEPIPARVELTDRDKAEADQLIQAVLGHWPAMKNTSVGGFRDSFLHRPGKLTPPDLAGSLGGWRLQVERKGFDIIMEQLPWSIHVVKLPWMPEPLYVEW